MHRPAAAPATTWRIASLTDNEAYAVTAYLLNLNGIIGENDEMNAQMLPKVKMPNQSNFIVVYPSRGR